MTSVPGVGIINGAQILARLGDPARFRSLAGARSFTGLVPSLTASGTSGRHGPPTKSGDAPLREALFMAADHARRADPTLAARYHRLMVTQGKHHNSALCHIAPALLTRIIACWRAGTPYQIRDTDGTPLTAAQGRAIIAERYQVSAELRAQRRTSHTKTGTSRRHQESPGAPTPARPHHHATTDQPNRLTPLKNSTGMVFTARLPGGRGGRNGLETELRRLGVTQKNGKPNHPQTQGKAERFQQTLKKWLPASSPRPPGLALQHQLDTFTSIYNTAPAAPLPAPPRHPRHRLRRPAQSHPRQPHHRHPPPRPPRPHRPLRRRDPAPPRQTPPHRHRPDPHPDPRPAPHPRPAHPRHQRRHRRTPPRTHPQPRQGLPAHRTPPKTPTPNTTTTPQTQRPRTLTRVRGHSDVLRHHREPPIGIEPMTYALRGARSSALVT